VRGRHQRLPRPELESMPAKVERQQPRSRRRRQDLDDGNGDEGHYEGV
jgi:hypothetical protein